MNYTLKENSWPDRIQSGVTLSRESSRDSHMFMANHTDCCSVVHANEHAPLVEFQLQFVRQLHVVTMALFINLGDNRFGEVCFHVVGDGSRDE